MRISQKTNIYKKMTRQEFQNIALLRQAESKSLFKRNHYDGCCYLAGYCLEAALKAAICKQMKSDNFFEVIRPETARAFKIHNLGELIILAGLSQEYKDLEITNPILLDNWEFIRDKIRWSEQLRYQVGFVRADAEQMILAISEPRNGILKWIKKYW